MREGPCPQGTVQGVRRAAGSLGPGSGGVSVWRQALRESLLTGAVAVGGDGEPLTPLGFFLPVPDFRQSAESEAHAAIWNSTHLDSCYY